MPSLTTATLTNCVPVTSLLPLSTQGIYGTIQIKDDVYEVLGILFSSTGFLGRGTVCYLVRRNSIIYIIKDHWVAGDPLHEANMLMRVQGIKGVPLLIDYWQVEVVEDVIEKMDRYQEEHFRSKMKSIRTHVRLVTSPQVCPLMRVSSKKELVIAIRGILSSKYDTLFSLIAVVNKTYIFIVQKEAVEERHLLHRDCSINNGMIEDGPDGPTGSLIDWEHAVNITKSNEYNVGGTVSSDKSFEVPF